MPSPIFRLTTGYLTNKSGARISCSKKNPVRAYLRNGTVNKGGWVYHAPKGKAYRVSVLKPGSDRHRASQNPYTVLPQYRHTGDWVDNPNDRRAAILMDYPSGVKKPPMKARKRLGAQAFTVPNIRYVGKGKRRHLVGGEAKVVKWQQKLDKAKRLKKQAVKAKEQGHPQKAKKLAAKAVSTAKAVAKAKSAPKSVKKEAKGTVRAAKKTQKSASKAAKAAGV